MENGFLGARIPPLSRVVSITLFILLCFNFIRSSLAASNKVRVLFVGNSLTYVNDLPRTIAGFAKSRHIDMEYDMYAPGGYTLLKHATDAALLDKIKKNTWDFVVLQEQSQMPALPQAQFERYVLPYAKTLCALIKKTSPNARVVFYETMARKNGDPEYVSSNPELATYEGMQRRINAGYFLMAKDNGALIAPVGLVWGNVRTKYPGIELYGDDVHPNSVGTYLAACVFYATFFGDSPIGLPHPKQIDDLSASYLQKMASDTIPRAASFSRAWRK